VTDEPNERSGAALAERSNKIRASVLGANDGIVSTAGLVLGVAGATTSTEAILVAGLAGLVAGALSMAAGEYVSVSSQRDIEQSAVAREQRQLAEHPEEELTELADIFEKRGLSKDVAREVAEELTARDAIAAHTREEYGIEPGEYLNPWAAGISSLLAFTAGAALPLLGMALFDPGIRVAATFIAVLLALVVTGYVSAKLGGARIHRAVLRNVAGGALAMAATYGIGVLIGGAVA
jgi:VIT1/CCC1 family predicted Fe2+/Mn2+ transporter